MSWQQTHAPARTASLDPPSDGIIACTHPPGWLGRRWQAIFDRLPRDASSRLLRGRNFARRGRLRELMISPGLATAELVCEDCYRPTVRVRAFSRPEWAKILKYLLTDIGAIASLLEGEMPEAFVRTLEDKGVTLLPTFAEIESDCECGDYVMPCAHAAAVFHALSDAIDGDPFLLLTLRGRPREQLLATLRVHWGDREPMLAHAADTEEVPPAGDWLTAKHGLPDFACTYDADAVPAAGLRALGPPPGDSDLLAALTPLYVAGGAATRATIDTIPERVVVRRAPADKWTQTPGPRVKTPELESEEPLMAQTRNATEGSGGGTSRNLTEKLVDILARQESASSKSLADQLDVALIDVRNELLELEKLGLVYRTGQTRGTRWWLG